MIAYEDTEAVSKLNEDCHINVSAFRLLYIYLLLCKSQYIAFEDLNTHLLNHSLIQKTFTNETLNKYMNTLRMFGCKIRRNEEQDHHIYHLEDNPLKPLPSKDELDALITVMKLVAFQTISSMSEKFYFMTKRFYIYSDALQFAFVSTLNSPVKVEIEANKNKHEIELFQKYCLEGQVLEICYETQNKFTLMALIEPINVIYHKKTFYLVGTCTKTLQNVRYEIEKIHYARQLPNRTKLKSFKTTVIFKLTGRAAANYRHYPEEKTWCENDALFVEHKTDDIEQLLKRLLKYGSLCQIISPDNVKNSMLGIIEHMLQITEEPVEQLIAHLSNREQTDENLRKWACYFDSPQTLDDEEAD